MQMQLVDVLLQHRCNSNSNSTIYMYMPYAMTMTARLLIADCRTQVRQRLSYGRTRIEPEGFGSVMS